MTLAAWRKKFYPKEARSTTKKEAVLHSLVKWIGLREDNLEKFAIRYDDYYLVDDTRKFFAVGSSTCALCYHYDDDCLKCPLAIARNGFACNSRADDESDSPWSVWCTTSNPEPMIRALENALTV